MKRIYVLALLIFLIPIQTGAKPLEMSLYYEQEGNYTHFFGKTNLPDGTKLHIGIPNGASAGDVYVKDGSFRTIGLTRRGRRFNAPYTIEVYSHFTKYWQDKGLLPMYEEYTGPLIKYVRAAFDGQILKTMKASVKVDFSKNNSGVNLLEKISVSHTKEIFLNEKHLIITGKTVNVRVSPHTSSEIIVQARERDIFELRSRVGKWYKIHLFSGEPRYVYGTLAKPINWKAPDIPSEDTRRTIYGFLMNASDSAEREAERKYPIYAGVSTEYIKERNLYNSVLEDKLSYSVLKKYKILGVDERKIIAEGNNKRWW